MSLKAWFRLGCIFSTAYSISWSTETFRMSVAFRLLAAAGLFGLGHLQTLHTSLMARLMFLHLVQSQSDGFSVAAAVARVAGAGLGPREALAMAAARFASMSMSITEGSALQGQGPNQI